MEPGLKLVDRLGITLRPEFVEVEVTGVRLTNGDALRVRCVRPDAEEMAQQMGFLPGDVPASTPSENQDERKSLLEWAPGLIERWVKVEVDGEWVPAFSFADPCPDDRIPGRELTTVDIANLGMKVMRLGGYAGGPEAGTRFLGQ